MRKYLSLCLLLLLTYVTEAQPDHVADSLKKNLSLCHTDADKVYTMMKLANYYNHIDDKLSQSYAEQAIEIAELSRDRKLIALVWLKNGHRLENMSDLASNITLAMDSYQRAEKVARENDLEDELGYAYLGMAAVNRIKGDFATALNYNNLAFSIAGSSRNDSLKVTAYNSTGETYRHRNEKLLAFRNYLDALNVAELSGRNALIKIGYGALCQFYVSIEEYDKAIDYGMKILSVDRKDQNRVDLLSDYNLVGNLFAYKKQTDLALSMYEKSIALADSMQFSMYKLNSYLSIVDMYFHNDEMKKGMTYLNEHRTLLDFFQNSGLEFYLDEIYAGVYSELGKYDSAYYFFKKSEPEIEQKAPASAKCNFYQQYGDFYKNKGDYRMGIVYYLKAKQVGEDMKDIYVLQICAKNLDTLYDKAGDYKTAYAYNVAYNQYKDSIQSLAREADVLKLEVDNDNRRRERQAREEEETTQRRHNIQYMGFTAGIVCLFIVLVMLGFFMVSPRTIRALGFFSFIFLFEFIILLADKQIHEWTHGEPWKILLIKIFLAAILLPLHHWLEHKVIHYLSTRRKIAPGGGWFKFKKKEEVGTA